MPYQATAKTRKNQADKKRRIADAARRLVAEGGFAAASVSAVAERAGIATGTVYRYFPSKGDLVAAVFRGAAQREVDEMDAAASGAGDVAQRLEHAVRTFAARAIAGRRMAYALIAEPVHPAVDEERILYRHAYAQVLESLIAEALADGSAAPTDPAITAAFLVGALAESLVGPLAPEAAAVDADFLTQTIVDAAHRVVFGGRP